MTDGIDRTARTLCPVFEELAVAWHEAGHAVGAVLVSPGLFIETVTIVPGDGYLGMYTLEDWRENLVPDVDDDAGFGDWREDLVPDVDDGASFGDWSDDLVPDEDSGEIGEHERQYLRALDTVSALGAMAEGMLLHGRPDKPVMAGAGGDQANAHANAEAVLEDDIFRKAGYYHGPRGLEIDGALTLIRRHPYFWQAVGLVAGALLREKTLDGSEVEALVRGAKDGE